MVLSLCAVCVLTMQDSGLLYIAEWALKAPVPDGWFVHLDPDGNEFFHNPDIQVSSYEHPCDETYRQHYLMAKLELQKQQQQ